MRRYFNKRGLTCATCGRRFNEGQADHLRDECYEIASYDNYCNDNSAKLEGRELTTVARYLADIAKKGGDIERVKSNNDFINWEDVVLPTSRTVNRVGSTKATNGVAAPVTVKFADGTTIGYRSVTEAFKRIGLPWKAHKKFRVMLKTRGTAIFTHLGVEYHFTAAGF